MHNAALLAKKTPKQQKKKITSAWIQILKHQTQILKESFLTFIITIKRKTQICISYSVADDFHTIVTLSKQLIQDRLKMRTWRINEKLIIINYISIIS